MEYIDDDMDAHLTALEQQATAAAAPQPTLPPLPPLPLPADAEAALNAELAKVGRRSPPRPAAGGRRARLRAMEGQAGGPVEGPTAADDAAGGGQLPDRPAVDLEAELQSLEGQVEGLKRDMGRAARGAEAPTTEMFQECQVGNPPGGGRGGEMCRLGRVLPRCNVLTLFSRFHVQACSK